MKKLKLMAASLAATLALPVMAAHAFPNGPITVIVPFGAGGGTDAVARVITDAMSRQMGADFIVDNRGGANGSIGASAVAMADPNGQTILMTTSTTHAANPSLLQTLNYDPINDYEAVARIGFFPFILAVSPELPVETIDDFLAYAKDNPGNVTYAHWQATTIIAGSTLEQLAGIDLLEIPYTGTTPALTDVMAGRVDAIFIDVPAGISQIEAGAIRALAATTPERTDLVPDVPSLDEAGVTGYSVSSWMGVYAPAGTPEDVVNQLSDLIVEVLADDDVQERLAGLGFQVAPMPADEFADYTESEIGRWAEMVEAAGIEPQ